MVKLRLKDKSPHLLYPRDLKNMQIGDIVCFVSPTAKTIYEDNIPKLHKRVFAKITSINKTFIKVNNLLDFSVKWGFLCKINNEPYKGKVIRLENPKWYEYRLREAFKNAGN
jgi:hypothetical protein